MFNELSDLSVSLRSVFDHDLLLNYRLAVRNVLLRDNGLRISHVLRPAVAHFAFIMIISDVREKAFFPSLVRLIFCSWRWTPLASF